MQAKQETQNPSHCAGVFVFSKNFSSVKKLLIQSVLLARLDFIQKIEGKIQCVKEGIFQTTKLLSHMNKLSSYFVTLLLFSVSTLSFADPRCGFKVNSHPKEVTTERVIDSNADITKVFRLEDGSWLFLSESIEQHNELVGTTIEELVQRDPTLCSIHDLPNGWVATRANKNDKWVRADGQ